MRSKIPEFHVMRALAIFIILFSHLTLYTFNFYDLHHWGMDVDISWLSYLNIYCALAIFIFISGYLINIKDVHLNSLTAIKKFLIKRYIRIFPLYILALAFFVFLLKDTIGQIGSVSFIIHLFGLQVLLASKYCDPILTLWFVGLIFSYYYLYIVLFKYSNDILNFLLVSFLILCVAIILKIFFHMIDKRFILYYVIFVLGTICSKTQLLQNFSMKQLRFIIIPWAISIYLYVLYVYPKVFQSESLPLFSLTGLYAFVLINLIMIFNILIVYLLARPVVHLKIYSYIEKASYASFVMFLFHRPILWLLLELWKPDNEFMRLAYLVLIGLPIIALSSYCIQLLYDRLIERLLINQLVVME